MEQNIYCAIDLPLNLPLKDVAPALIAFAAAILGAMVSAKAQALSTKETIEAEYKRVNNQIEAQYKNTKKLIEAEYEKINRQFRLQSLARLRARKEDWIIEKVVLLLDGCDPDLRKPPDYPSMVSAVHSIQVFLDLSLPKDRALNQAIQEFVWAARELFFCSDGDPLLDHINDLRSRNMPVEAMEADMEREELISRNILRCKSNVIRAAQGFLL